MPIIVISTNIQKSSFPDGFLEGFAKTYAETVNKEKSKNCNCCLHAGLDMIKNRNDKPAATISIRYASRQLDKDGKRTVTVKLMDYMKTQLDLNDDIMRRFVVVFEKVSKKDDMGNSA